MKQTPTPLTVTQLNRQIRLWLEQETGDIHVLGEISNFSKPASGHLYFTLKDETAQVRCVFFRSHHSHNGKQFENGQQVIAKGKLSLYEARGDYQLIVQELTQAGIGELYLQFERLKVKLEQQGLFAAHRKKPLPTYPVTLAVITSGTGAALRDILATLAKRFPIARVQIYPCEVQGKNAAEQLMKAIWQANFDNQADAILLARGGGSLEDLWPFNEEKLALAIAASTLPIVTGVGHETDFTIADFVADLRAATPTAAAQAVTPDKLELLNYLNGLMRRLTIAVARAMQYKQLILASYTAKLASPEQVIFSHWQSLDYCQKQLHQHLQRLLKHHQHGLHVLMATLQSHNPKGILQQASADLLHINQQLAQVMRLKLNDCKQQFSKLITTLQAVSPLATLDRGYAIALHNKKVIFDEQQVSEGDNLQLQLAKGQLSCRVLSKGK